MFFNYNEIKYQIVLIYIVLAIDNSGFSNLTTAQVHNHGSIGNGTNNKGYLKSQNCIDIGYYGNQLENDKGIQEEAYLDSQDSIDEYIEDENEDAISYGKRTFYHKRLSLVLLLVTVAIGQEISKKLKKY